jgi:serine-type D-Ala-D-Ala carboxypeptidase (penicillin-binding protein 5/6)
MKRLRLLLIVVLVGVFNLLPVVAGFDFRVNSEAYLIYNVDQDQVVMAEHEHDRLAPASMIKLLSAVIAFESVDLSSEVVVTSDMLVGLKAANASVMGLMVKEKISYEDLLYGLLMESGGDAAQVIAISIAGSMDDFVKLMNAKAQTIGMVNSNFMNPTGLDHPNQYSSAYDMMLLMKYVMQYPKLRTMLGTLSYTTKATNLHSSGIELSHTLKSLQARNSVYSPYVLGGKTGATDNAGRCVAGFGRVNDQLYIIIVMKSPLSAVPNHAMLDLKHMMNWLALSVKPVTLVSKGSVIKELVIPDGRNNVVKVVMPNDLVWYQVAGEPLPVPQYEISEVYGDFPIVAGSKLAQVKVIIDHRVVKTFDVVAMQDIVWKWWIPTQWLIGIVSCAMLFLIFLIRLKWADN